MADKKISQLNLTAAVNADDTMEKSNHNAAPSERYTPAQMATFMQTAMALVQLSGGNIKLNADGSASFAGVKILFNADGSCTFASANAGFAADGALNLPLSHLLADGSAQFANGAVNIDIAGGIQAADSITVATGLGNPTNLSSSGAATFANGSNTIDASGNIGIQGNQVVTSQQPAIADATNAVDVITQFNTLLAELRTHGLIAV